MKILYFMDGVGNAGGIQEQVLNWIKYFDSRVHVDILGYYQIDINGKKLNNEGAYIDRLNQYGCECFLISPFRKNYYRKCLKDTKEFFKKNHDYDIIEIHGTTKCYHIMKYAKKYGIKIRIAHSHNTKFQTNNIFKRIIGDFLKIKYNKLATHYFACSYDAGVWLFGKKICSSKKFYIINNAIDLKKFFYDDALRTKLRNELNLNDKKVIIHVGRFMKQKNHNFLIDVFNELYKRDSSYHLLCVGGAVRGDLSYKNNFEKKMNEYNLNKSVSLLGVRSDVNDLLNAADMFVFPSLYEGLGLVLIEAQATGLPCVASNMIPEEACVSHLLDNIDLNCSPATWADHIISVFNKNSEIRRAPVEEIREHNYDAEISSHKLEELYLEFVMDIKNEKK